MKLLLRQMLMGMLVRLLLGRKGRRWGGSHLMLLLLLLLLLMMIIAGKRMRSGRIRGVRRMLRRVAGGRVMRVGMLRVRGGGVVGMMMVGVVVMRRGVVMGVRRVVVGMRGEGVLVHLKGVERVGRKILARG